MWTKSKVIPCTGNVYSNKDRIGFVCGVTREEECYKCSLLPSHELKGFWLFAFVALYTNISSYAALTIPLFTSWVRFLVWQLYSKNKKNTFLKYLLIKPDSVFVFCSVVHKQNFLKLSDCIMFVTFIYMHEIHLDEEEEDTSSICNLIVQKTSLNSIR